MKHIEGVLLVLILSSSEYRTLDCIPLRKFFERLSFNNDIERVLSPSFEGVDNIGWA